MYTFEFNEIFKEYHKELFSHWKIQSLIEQEAILSQMINSNLFDSFVLIEELMVLRDLLRDECMKRLALRSHELE